MKSFDAAAKNYERHSQVQQTMADWLAEWIPCNRTGTALEIGAGTGLFTGKLLPWKGRLIASDAAPAMVSEGKRHHPKAEWIVARAENLPEISANTIFSSSFLQWSKNPPTMLTHWKTRLQPDGKILVGFFAAPSLSEIESVLPETAPLQWRTPDKWKSFFESTGFRVCRIESEQRKFYLPSALKLFRSLHGLGAAPVRKTSPAKLRRAISEYDRKFRDSEKGVRSTWTFVRIEAAAGQASNSGRSI